VTDLLRGFDGLDAGRQHEVAHTTAVGLVVGVLLVEVVVEARGGVLELVVDLALLAVLQCVLAVALVGCTAK